MNFKKIMSTSSYDGEIVSILDVGSSKVVCLIANIKSGTINIIGSGCHSANGFRNGVITNSELAKTSIIAAVDQAEKIAGITVDKIILALNGNKIRSHYICPSLELKKHKVYNRDINALITQGVRDLEKQGREVIHYFPLEYIIDGNDGIYDPSGLLGNKISAKIHFVTVPSIMLENIINCLASCQLDVEDCVFAPYAAGLATLNNSDKELGATIIDFGAGITSYAFFLQKNIVYCGFVPIGSGAITEDIAKSFMLDLSTAERIKTINGAASIGYADSQKMIHCKIDNLDDPFDHEERNISNAELNDVINARIEEILTLLKATFDKKKNFCETQRNIVLTGGGSLLSGISHEASKIFRSKVRLGKPITVSGLSAESINATYSAAIGVLKYFADKSAARSSKGLSKISLVRKFITWFKENF
ncbi:MAG: cell division protein FtsA [Rickettsiales bacterium]|jgi:cell division protein FtsA|nr:cell division protein FtsA [Rickettsiales bacterium]